jgi:hypothetical protein
VCSVLARAGDGARQHDKEGDSGRGTAGRGEDPPHPQPLRSVIPAGKDCCGLRPAVPGPPIPRHWTGRVSSRKHVPTVLPPGLLHVTSVIHR